VRLFAFTIFAVITAVTAVSVCHGEPASDRGAAASGHTLVGQLLLPRGSGSRGVEVVATFTETGSAPRKKWILFDEEGRFADTFRGRLTRMVVSTGLRTQLHSIEAEDLPEINQTGQVDVGVIDLRDRLIRHRLILRVGPSGEPVSLGSRQFPPVALGSEMEWLLPLKAQSLYFLVERPVGPALEPEWRGGYQRLFGPFTSSNLPAELTMD